MFLSQGLGAEVALQPAHVALADHPDEGVLGRRLEPIIGVQEQD